ncbi:MAG: hypothetical protein V4656_03275 [Pseudomonadota bacterium]
MRPLTLLCVIPATFAIAGAAAAQTNPPSTPARPATMTARPATATPAAIDMNALANRYSANLNGEPDVFLDIPNLSVEQITIEVDKLQVHLALDARLGSMLKLTAGADASVDKVKINIKGVKAQVQLKVHLANVAAILDRTLTTIDRNPQIIDRALGTVDNAVGTVGGVANNAVGTVGGVATQAIGPNTAQAPR